MLIDENDKDFEKEDLHNDENEVIESDEENLDDETNEDELEEGTSAAESLKPNSKPSDNPKSKLEAMTAVIGKLAAMSAEDINKFGETMAQVGKEADNVPDNSKKNAASVDMKAGAGPKTKDPMKVLSVKEDLNALFEGSELSEETKNKTEALFEAAVSSRVAIETVRIQEEQEAIVVEIIEALKGKLDKYLDHIAEKWMDENEVAINSTLRTEISEGLITGMAKLFAEHNINIPEEKVEVVEALADKVAQLEAALNDQINENQELKQEKADLEAADIVAEVSEGLTLADKEKFATLIENISYDGDEESFKQKLEVVKEKFLSAEEKKEDKKFEAAGLNEEVEIEEDKKEEIPQNMKVYADAISRTIAR